MARWHTISVKNTHNNSKYYTQKFTNPVGGTLKFHFNTIERYRVDTVLNRIL